MKKVLGLLATGLMALAANNASAIPLEINILSGGVAVGGDWTLSGDASASDNWGGFVDFQLETWTLDVLAGNYTWQITGGGFLAGVAWSLNLDGASIFSGSADSIHDGFFGFFSVNEDHTFDAAPVQVPEPGILLLLGGGLHAFATVGRRKTVRA